MGPPSKAWVSLLGSWTSGQLVLSGWVAISPLTQAHIQVAKGLSQLERTELRECRSSGWV
eukprot:5853042-Amphidinium_carterae.1